MFNVYGKKQNKQYAGVITKFLKNITENKPLVVYGDGKQTRDFISINDVVESFGCAIKSNTNGMYNIASGVSILINELAEIMFDVFRKQKIKYFEKQKGDMQNSFADVSLAKKELCFTSRRSLKEELVRL
jgi:UDP-glucose 4-epimerase